MKKKQRTNKQERGKTVPKFKILDAVIILLILVSVVGIYLSYNITDTLKNRKDLKEYVVEFSIQDIRNSTQDYINIGDVVYYSEDGEVLGTLLGYIDDATKPLTYGAAEDYFVDQAGNTQLVTYPLTDQPSDRIDATGRFSCKGIYTEDGGFLVNGSRYLAPGQEIQVRTELVTLTITIKDIKLPEATE